MVSERQKYISTLLKNIGYGFFAPIGSILFQWIVFKTNLLSGHILFGTVSFLLGWFFIGYGYIILNDEEIGYS